MHANSTLHKIKSLYMKFNLTPEHSSALFELLSRARGAASELSLAIRRCCARPAKVLQSQSAEQDLRHAEDRRNVRQAKLAVQEAASSVDCDDQELKVLSRQAVSRCLASIHAKKLGIRDYVTMSE